MKSGLAKESRTKGIVLHGEARYYDLLAWLLTLGRESAFRGRLLTLARVAPGESVLDVGCGTGTLAIAAKRRIGTAGVVHGVDASPEMIERAIRKRDRAGVSVGFQVATAEALPFPDAHFDVVMSTLMLHHLPKAVRQRCAREIRRVLKPNGRLLAVDFATPARSRKGLFARLHRHGSVPLRDIVELLSGNGLEAVESGSVGVSDLQYVLAAANHRSMRNAADDAERLSAPQVRSLGRLPVPRWLWGALAVAAVSLHALILRDIKSRFAVSAVAIALIAVLVVIMHSGRARRHVP